MIALPGLQGSQKLMQLSMGRLFSMLVERMDASVQGEVQPRMLLYSGHDTWVWGACTTLTDSACTRPRSRCARRHSRGPLDILRMTQGQVWCRLCLHKAASLCARRRFAAVLLRPGSRW